MRIALLTAILLDRDPFAGVFPEETAVFLQGEHENDVMLGGFAQFSFGRTNCSSVLVPLLPVYVRSHFDDLRFPNSSRLAGGSCGH